MKANYRRELEKTARQMIVIHRADVLIKLVLRTIIRNLKVCHAGILIYDKKRDEYVVSVSRGDFGFKIPSGFVKVKATNPLIRYFLDKKIPLNKNYILLDSVISCRRDPSHAKRRKLIAFLQGLEDNLNFYQARVCIPGFFRKDLIGVLFLGRKINNRNFSEGEIGFLSVLASDVVMALKNAWLIEDLSRQLEANKRLFFQMVTALASSIEAKDKYTKGHTERVVYYSLAIAANLKRSGGPGWHKKLMEDLKISALLHDIGKIGVPEAILNKPSVLTAAERKIIERHPVTGAAILKNIDELSGVILGVMHHHERFDGRGYPNGLKGDNIPFIAAIIGLADAYDAMTSDRPYRKALSPRQALAEIKKNRGKQFSPVVVDAFLKFGRVEHSKETK